MREQELDDQAMDKRLFKKNLMLFLFFGLLFLALFSPIASNVDFPNSKEFANHLIAISEAKNALLAGQFPIRVTPSMGQQYPYFQFYSPLPYMIAGFFDLYFNNPLMAYKTTMWFALLFAGFSLLRLIKLFIPSNRIALVAAVLYLTSPYLLINMTARGDFTESFAMCLLPIILYYSISYLRTGKFYEFIGVAIMWSLLALAHIITFIFSVFFIGIFLIVINIAENIPLKNLFYLALAFIAGCILAMWNLAPIILFHHSLYIQDGLVNPAHTTWLNPLSTLLSPIAMSPMSLPGDGRIHYPLYLGLGFPTLFAFGLCCYLKFFKKTTPYFVSFLLCYFVFTFLLIWSPVDVWKFLPSIVDVLQFSFRLLIQLMWMTSILFAWGIYKLVNKEIKIKYVIIILFAIILGNSSWLVTSPNFPETITTLINKSVFYEKSFLTYTLNPSLIQHEKTLLGLASQCQNDKKGLRCEINASANQHIALPINYYQDMLNVKVDGKTVNYFPAESTLQNDNNQNALLAGISLSEGHHVIEAKFVGLEYANEISLLAWISIMIFLFCDLLISFLSLKKEDTIVDTANFDKNGADL